jgi:competence protein ComEC
MIRKMFVLFAVLLLFAGCPSEDGGTTGTTTTGGVESGTGGTQEHFQVEEGTKTSASTGEREEGETAPAVEYAEDVNDNLFVYFITVGYGDTQGDAILVKKGDFDMVIDGGPVENKHKVVNYLFGKGVDDIEVLVSTHDDPEHSGGLSYIGENFQVGEVWRPKEGSDEYGAMLEAIGAEHGVKYMGKDDERIFNGIHVLLKNPEPTDERFFDPDNDAIVMRLEDRGFCILLTADIDGSAQTVILIDSEPCEVVQMPWHGMSEGLSNLDYFFDKLEPRDVIISGSSKDWTNSRQTLYNKAALRDITIYENYEGDAAKVTFNGEDYAITIEG